MEIPLRLGPLRVDGYNIHRSGVRWLCEPGQMCRANQVVAYFNLSFEPAGAWTGGPPPFGEEKELQVACAPRVGGRLMFDPDAAPGGYLSIMRFNLWDPDAVLGHLEIEGSSTDLDTDAGRLRLLMLAGRRMSPLVVVHSGLLPGWHGRSRGWWCEEGETPVTLLSLGVCDVTGVILGEQCAFLEMFQSEAAPTQFVFVPDHPIAPAAPVLLDQLERSTAQFRAISADMHASLSKPGIVPTADDWMFAGTLLSMMQRCPIRETHDLLSTSGLTRSGPADAVLLSLNAEPPAILRHKTLGYRLHVLRHFQTAAGPVIRSWLANAFESVERTTDDIKTDYENLIDAIGKSTGAQVIILNRMSTSGDENISTYAPFDSPMSGTLANIASKELNLMLHDLAASRNVSIIDIDAIAADIGGGEHLPDGVHQSRVMQDILRGEILHVLKGLGAKS
jgi:hypothetical protein